MIDSSIAGRGRSLPAPHGAPASACWLVLAPRCWPSPGARRVSRPVVARPVPATRAAMMINAWGRMPPWSVPGMGTATTAA
jgi:hypothetical protein